MGRDRSRPYGYRERPPSALITGTRPAAEPDLTRAGESQLPAAMVPAALEPVTQDQLESRGNNLAPYDAAAEKPAGEWDVPLAVAGLQAGDFLSASAEMKPTGAGVVAIALRFLDGGGATIATFSEEQQAGAAYLRLRCEAVKIPIGAAIVRIMGIVVGAGSYSAQLAMLNRGKLALPFEEPPFRPSGGAPFTGTLDDVADGSLYARTVANYLSGGKVVKVLRATTDESVDNLFKRGANSLTDVLDDASFAKVIASYTSSGKVVKLLRAAVDELPDNLFKRGSNTLVDVLDDATWAKTITSYLSSGKVAKVLRATLDEIPDNLFKRGVNSLSDVTDDASYAKVVAAYIASGKVSKVLRSGTDEDPANLFKRGVNALSDVLDDASYSKIVAAYVSLGKIIKVLRSGTDEDPANLFKRGVNNLDDVLDSGTRRRTTNNEADGGGRAFSTHDGANRIWAPAGSPVGVGVPGTPGALTKTVRIAFPLFQPASSGTGYTRTPGYLGTNTAGTFEHFAPVYVPVGATITSMRFYSFLSASAGSVNCQLQRKTDTGSTSATVANGTNLTLGGWTSTTVACSETVSSAFSYIIDLTLGSGTDNSLGAAGLSFVEITYTIPDYAKGI